MKIYPSIQEAVADMHERGYTNDFRLSGNDLLWVQGKMLVRTGDFAILEYHRFANSRKNRADLILFGILALNNSAKGLLLNHCSKLTMVAPPVMVKKLNDIAGAVAYQAPVFCAGLHSG